uniref:Uncharacterized protein n=1 Tax=Anguilla anguilla TaxID=7936 RepID=A0A0E9PS18_ANGAN
MVLDGDAVSYATFRSHLISHRGAFAAFSLRHRIFHFDYH